MDQDTVPWLQISVHEVFGMYINQPCHHILQYLAHRFKIEVDRIAGLFGQCLLPQYVVGVRWPRKSVVPFSGCRGGGIGLFPGSSIGTANLVSQSHWAVFHIQKVGISFMHPSMLYNFHNTPTLSRSAQLGNCSSFVFDVLFSDTAKDAKNFPSEYLPVSTSSGPDRTSPVFLCRIFMNFSEKLNVFVPCAPRHIPHGL
jgi:hypothetical protein